MKHATYVGIEESLRGQGALIRPSANEGKVMAQFDYLGEHNSGYDRGLMHNGVNLSYGWHEFDATDFADDFTMGYVTCALWSSTDESDESGGEPMDKNYDWTDIAPETMKEMVADCIDFQTSFAELLAKAYEHPNYQGNEEYSSQARAGHDFWLTRNRHGAGFWGWNMGEIGDELTKVSHPYGSFDLYVGDDWKIYGG